ncbi:MAG: hypothetical protein Q9224_001101 [Gallowayella concinna]
MSRDVLPPLPVAVALVAMSTPIRRDWFHCPLHRQQPYYPQPPPPNQQAPRRSSPQSSYSYEQRASGSPHGSASSASAYNYAPAGLHPPQVLPNRDGGRTPPPRSKEGGSNSAAQRGKMGIHDLLGPGESSGGRTSADTDMVKALDRKGM